MRAFPAFSLRNASRVRLLHSSSSSVPGTEQYWYPLCPSSITHLCHQTFELFWLCFQIDDERSASIKLEHSTKTGIRKIYGKKIGEYQYCIHQAHIKLTTPVFGYFLTVTRRSTRVNRLDWDTGGLSSH